MPIPQPVAPTGFDARVKVETAWLPTLDVKLGGAAAKPNPILKVLKPRVTLYAGETRIASTAPYGDPGSTRWPVVKWAVLVGALFVGWRLARFVL